MGSRSDRRKKMGEKLNKRIETGRKQSKGNRKSIIKPEEEVQNLIVGDGDHLVDLIPYTAGKHDPLVPEGDPTYTYEYKAHVNVGPNNLIFLCPTEMFNEPCPICEKRQRLREKGASKDVYKVLFPKKRNLYNVICYDKGEEKKGVQVWDVSWHYFEKFILAISKKKGRHGKPGKKINFAHPDKGKSISFEVEPAKGEDDYPKYLGHSFDDRDYKISDEILDDAKILDMIVHRPTYDEILEADKGKKGKKDKKGKKGKDQDSESDDLLEELEDLDDIKELKEFIKENGLDIKVKKKEKANALKKRIKKALEEEDEEDDNEDEDEDGDDDDDEEGDEEGDDEDEDEDDDDEDDDDEDGKGYTKKDIRKMKMKELKKVIKEEDLDEIDIGDYEKDDIDDLKDDIIDALGL